MQAHDVHDAEAAVRPVALLVAVCFVIVATSVGTLALLRAVFAGS